MYCPPGEQCVLLFSLQNGSHVDPIVHLKAKNFKIQFHGTEFQALLTLFDL